MTSKHTPGPWVLIRSGMRDDSAIATVEPKPETMEEPNYWTVAQTNTLREEWQANARLIASAPKLLSTLEHLLSTLDGVSWSDMEGSSAKAVFDVYMKASEVVEEAKGNKK